MVSKCINGSSAKNRIEVSEQLLSILQSLSVSQTSKIIIADEPWFFLYYTLDQMWCYSRIRPTKPLHKIAEEKVMIFTAFLLKGLVFAKALPK